MPVTLQVFLILVVGNYTAARSPAFLSEFNLNSVLLAALPLALVAMAQVNALLVGYLDISVGAIMTVCVIIASFMINADASATMVLVGVVAILLTGVLVGLFNAGLIHG